MTFFDQTQFVWQLIMRQLKIYWIALLIFMIGTCLSFVVFYLDKSWHLKQQQTEFQRVADIQFYTIKDTLTDTIDQLQYIKQLYYSVETFTKQNFEIFAHHLLQNNPGLHAIGWLSKKEMDLSSSFLNFTDLFNPNSSILHFPLLYLAQSISYPLSLNHEAFDNFLKELKLSQQFISITISNPLLFYQTHEATGFFVFDSIANEQKEPVSTNSILTGTIIGLIELEPIIKHALKKLETVDHHILITDITTQPKQIVFSFNPALTTNTLSKEQLEWKRTHELDLANHKWQIEISPSQDFIQRQKNWFPWQILLVGLGVSGLTGAYVFNLINRKNLVDREVLKHTYELKQTNQTLYEEVLKHKQLEERQKFITQKAIDAIVTLSDKGNIHSWNLGAEQLFGYSEQEMLGQQLDKVFSLENLDLNQKNPPTVELQGKNRFLESFPIEISPSCWESEGQCFYTFIIRDITKRKKHEQTLLTAAEEAQAANQAKNEFVTTLSHELKTPLNAIIGFTECLLIGMDGPLNHQQEQSLNKVKKSALHLLKLINGLLELAKIDARKMELDLKIENLIELAQNCIEELSPLSISKHLPIYLISQVPQVLLKLDKLKIRQVLLNLLDNAIKFTDKGNVKMIIQEQTDRVEIIVSDTGIGLSDEESKTIFKPFQQANKTINQKYGGTGLGLAISKHLIELHGGNLQVESQQGKGSSFKIILPK